MVFAHEGHQRALQWSRPDHPNRKSGGALGHITCPIFNKINSVFVWMHLCVHVCVCAAYTVSADKKSSALHKIKVKTGQKDWGAEAFSAHDQLRIHPESSSAQKEETQGLTHYLSISVYQGSSGAGDLLVVTVLLIGATQQQQWSPPQPLPPEGLCPGRGSCSQVRGMLWKGWITKTG